MRLRVKIQRLFKGSHGGWVGLLTTPGLYLWTLDAGKLLAGDYVIEPDESGRFRHYRITNYGISEARAFEIHEGNFASDTEGCILVGDGVTAMLHEATGTVQTAVTNSTRVAIPALRNTLGRTGWHYLRIEDPLEV